MNLQNKEIEKAVLVIQGILAGLEVKDQFFITLSKITKDGVMTTHAMQGFDSFQVVGLLENIKMQIQEAMKKQNVKK